MVGVGGVERGRWGVTEGWKGGEVSVADREDVSTRCLVYVRSSVCVRSSVRTRSSFRIALLTASRVLDIPCTIS